MFIPIQIILTCTPFKTYCFFYLNSISLLYSFCQIKKIINDSPFQWGYGY